MSPEVNSRCNHEAGIHLTQPEDLLLLLLRILRMTYDDGCKYPETGSTCSEWWIGGHL
jgi:hypothetical protein